MNPNKIFLVLACATISFGALHAMGDIAGTDEHSYATRERGSGFSRPTRRISAPDTNIQPTSPAEATEQPATDHNQLPRDPQPCVSTSKKSAPTYKASVCNGVTAVAELLAHNPYTRVINRGADALASKVDGENQGVVSHLTAAFVIALRNHPYLTPMITAFLAVNGIKALYRACSDEEDEDELYGDNDYRDCSYYRN